MKAVLPIRPKQRACYDYTSIFGRSVRFKLEITYDATIENDNPFGVRIFYDTPPRNPTIYPQTKMGDYQWTAAATARTPLTSE